MNDITCEEQYVTEWNQYNATTYCVLAYSSKRIRTHHDVQVLYNIEIIRFVLFLYIFKYYLVFFHYSSIAPPVLSNNFFSALSRL